MNELGEKMNYLRNKKLKNEEIGENHSTYEDHPTFGCNTGRVQQTEMRRS